MDHDPTQRTPRSVRPSRRLDLEARLTALRHGALERTPTPAGHLALAIPPRATTALEVIGCFPLLRAPQIAEVCACPAARTRETLALLAAHDLVDPQECGKERVGRYVLTERGLRLLAARAGVPVATYREAYGMLEDRELGVRHGLDFAAANLAHTTALQEVFLSFVRAARAQGGRLSWRGEWACVRTFEREGKQHLLRPDAEAEYADGAQHLHIIVELDRSTSPLGDIAAQLTRYHWYAQTLMDATLPGRHHSNQPRVLVAFVATKSDARAQNIIVTANTVALVEGRNVLDVRATSLRRLVRRGALGRIWRRNGEARLTALFPENRPTGMELSVKSPDRGRAR